MNTHMSKSSRHAVLIALGAMASALTVPSGFAQDRKPYEYKAADQGQLRNQGGGALIMPSTFLREYDPVTILYNRDMNPGGAGPIDKPEQYLVLKPGHAGEYRWLDPRTLEFRPAIPWKPMQVYSVKASGESRTLTALLSPPASISPASGSNGLEPFSRVELEFAQPVAPEILAKLVTFEASQLPGIESRNARIYGSSDYRIKVSERSGRGSARYAFVFKKPFANGQRIRTVVRLAADPSLTEAKRVYYADTRKEFTVERAGTYEYQFTLNSSGSTYGRDQAIRLSQDGTLLVDFSAAPASLSLSQVKSLLNFSPAPRRMDWTLSGNRLTARISVDQERLYHVVIAPVDIKDSDGRKLTPGQGLQLLRLSAPRQAVRPLGPGARPARTLRPSAFPPAGQRRQEPGCPGIQNRSVAQGLLALSRFSRAHRRVEPASRTRRRADAGSAISPSLFTATILRGTSRCWAARPIPPSSIWTRKASPASRAWT